MTGDTIQKSDALEYVLKYHWHEVKTEVIKKEVFHFIDVRMNDNMNLAADANEEDPNNIEVRIHLERVSELRTIRRLIG